MKRLFALLAALLLLPLSALGEETPSPAETALPISGPAPFAPVESAFTEDGMGYDDGTMSVRIEQDVAFGTNITYVYVTISHPSQLRTALAAKYPSKKTQTVPLMAQNNNAVLAINGDFFSYHSEGIIMRGGELLRQNTNSRSYGRDVLIINDQGDFDFLIPCTKDNWNAYEGTPVHTFSFGPALIINSEVQEFNYRKKTSCGYPTPAQRIAICQLDTLSYLIVATEGPEQDKAAGLSVPQLTELLVAKGVKHAYNLDGGSSTTVMLGDRRINAPETDFRSVGDIIYFATLRAE